MHNVFFPDGNAARRNDDVRFRLQFSEHCRGFVDVIGQTADNIRVKAHFFQTRAEKIQIAVINTPRLKRFARLEKFVARAGKDNTRESAYLYLCHAE